MIAFVCFAGGAMMQDAYNGGPAVIALVVLYASGTFCAVQGLLSIGGRSDGLDRYR